MRIAKIDAAGVHYLHKDHLGSTVAVTGDDGAVEESLVYMPYGSMRAGINSGVTDFKFTDQELDSETGLYNYRARLYDPMLARFVSPDSTIPDLYDLQSLNRYSYVLNNPLIYTDPTGNSNYSDFGTSNNYGRDLYDDKQPTSELERSNDLIQTYWENAHDSYFSGDVDSVDEGFEDAVNDLAIANLTSPNSIFSIVSKVFKIGFVRNLLRRTPKNLPKSCFIAGTLIASSDGNKPIEKIEKNNSIWSYDNDRKIWLLQKVSNILAHEFSGEIITIQIGNVAIEATSNHPFRVIGGADLLLRPIAGDIPIHERRGEEDAGKWVEAGKLKIGDTLLTISGEIALITKLERKHRTVRVFNLSVYGFNNYAVSSIGVLVHNKGGALRKKPGKLGQFKGTNALRRENNVARDAARKAGLTIEQRDKLHEEITGQNLSFKEILEIAIDIKEGNL